MDFYYKFNRIKASGISKIQGYGPTFFAGLETAPSRSWKRMRKFPGEFVRLEFNLFGLTGSSSGTAAVGVVGMQEHAAFRVHVARFWRKTKSELFEYVSRISPFEIPGFERSRYVSLGVTRLGRFNDFYVRFADIAPNQ